MGLGVLLKTCAQGKVLPCRVLWLNFSSLIKILKMNWMLETKVKLVGYTHNKFQVPNHNTKFMKITTILMKI